MKEGCCERDDFAVGVANGLSALLAEFGGFDEGVEGGNGFDQAGHGEGVEDAAGFAD
jgi:hypothetical protein